MKQEKVNLFVYGTLTEEKRVVSLTGKPFRRQRAELHHYKRINPKEGYPYIIPKAGDRVRGYVLYGVDPLSLAALDRYEEEGVFYLRRPVEVEVNGKRILCQAYIGNPEKLQYSGKQDRHNTGKKDAIKRSRPTNRSHRSTQTRDAAEVEKVCSNKAT